MNDENIDGYVHAALGVAGYRLDPAQSAAVLAEFRRIAALAQEFVDVPAAFEDEALAQFRP
jgi:hypothetical protein